MNSIIDSIKDVTTYLSTGPISGNQASSGILPTMPGNSAWVSNTSDSYMYNNTLSMKSAAKAIVAGSENRLVNDDYAGFYRELSDAYDCPSILMGAISEFLMFDCGIFFLDYMEEIPKGCFAHLRGKYIKIPEHIKFIGEDAFAYCSGVMLRIPDNLKMDIKAFNHSDVTIQCVYGSPAFTGLKQVENTIEGITVQPIYNW